MQATEALAPIIRRIHERVRQEATPGERTQLLAVTYVLLSLRVTETEAPQLLQGVQTKEDSTTYQAILRKGKTEGRADGDA
jgi:hypothetical protein